MARPIYVASWIIVHTDKGSANTDTTDGLNRQMCMRTAYTLAQTTGQTA